MQQARNARKKECFSVYIMRIQIFSFAQDVVMLTN